jgi:hypothetical protein
MRSEKNFLSGEDIIWPSLFPVPLIDEHAECDQPPGFHCLSRGK